METKRAFTYPISPVARIIAVGFAVEFLHGVGVDISRNHGDQGRRMVAMKEAMIQGKSRYTLCQLNMFTSWSGQRRFTHETTLFPSFESCEAKIRLGIKLPTRDAAMPEKAKSGSRTC